MSVQGPGRGLQGRIGQGPGTTDAARQVQAKPAEQGAPKPAAAPPPGAGSVTDAFKMISAPNPFKFKPPMQARGSAGAPEAEKPIVNTKEPRSNDFPVPS